MQNLSSVRQELIQKTEENCSEEILDFFHCQDFCASKGLFSNLK